MNFTQLSKLIKFFLINSIRVFLWIYSRILYKPRKKCLPPINDPLLLKPATAIADEIRQGKIKSKDVVQTFLKRIKAVNPLINAIVDMNKNAIKEAEHIDELVRRERAGETTSNGNSINNMPLLGVPFTVKDQIAVKGLLYTGGLYARRNTIATEDSDVVANLRKAGAIPIAITNVPELLMWWDSTSTLVGRTVNPYDLSCTSGGSTGGEGAIVSAACMPFGIGSDIGGSIRNPSFRCGIFGHKVTPCVMPNTNLYPDDNEIISPLFTTGPMCRYACDIIPTLKASAGDRVNLLKSLDTPVDLSTIKIFYMFETENILRPRLHSDVKDALKKVVDYFEKKYNVDCVEVKFEEFSMMDEIYTQLFSSGRDFHADISYDGPKINLYTEFIKAMLGLSDHTVPAITFAYLSELDPNFDHSKMEKFKRAKQRLLNLLGTNGIFLFPSWNQVAQRSPETALDLFTAYNYTAIFNSLSVPVTQCPLGLNADGMPLGVQVVTSPYNDYLSISVALELEKAFGGWVSPSTIKCKVNGTNGTINGMNGLHHDKIEQN